MPTVAAYTVAIARLRACSAERWTLALKEEIQQAVTQVVQALAANGANIHAVFHTANNTVVIDGAGGGE
jgi:hypothetical protein